MGEHNDKVNSISLEKNMALLVFVLCILAGGLGTIIAGVLSKDDDKQKSAIILGIVQWLLAFLVIGWLWSIYSGWKIYSNAK